MPIRGNKGPVIAADGEPGQVVDGGDWPGSWRS